MKTINSTFLTGLQLATVSAAILAAYPSQAAILSFTGQVTMLESPSNIVTQESRWLQAFNEKQNVLLSAILKTNNPNNWGRLLPGGIPKGTRINSDYIYLNPPPRTKAQGYNTFNNAVGTITFDGPILGLIGSHGRFQATNGLLGLDSVYYPQKNEVRQLDNKNPDGSQDSAIFDGNILTLNFSALSGIDPIRVITLYQEPLPASTNAGKILGAYGSYLDEAVPVPEPFMAVGSSVAVGLGMLWRKKRAN